MSALDRPVRPIDPDLEVALAALRITGHAPRRRTWHLADLETLAAAGPGTSRRTPPGGEFRGVDIARGGLGGWSGRGDRCSVVRSVIGGNVSMPSAAVTGWLRAPLHPALSSRPQAVDDQCGCRTGARRASRRVHRRHAEVAACGTSAAGRTGDGTGGSGGGHPHVAAVRAARLVVRRGWHERELHGRSCALGRFCAPGAGRAPAARSSNGRGWRRAA